MRYGTNYRGPIWPRQDQPQVFGVKSQGMKMMTIVVAAVQCKIQDNIQTIIGMITKDHSFQELPTWEIHLSTKFPKLGGIFTRWRLANM